MKNFGANISNVRGFRGFTILSGFNSQLRVYGDDLMVDPSKILFRMVYRIAVQNLALLSSRSASFQKLGHYYRASLSYSPPVQKQRWRNIKAVARGGFTVLKNPPRHRKVHQKVH